VAALERHSARRKDRLERLLDRLLRTAASSPGLWADNGRYGLGFLLARTQVEEQKRRHERTERGEYGVDDYSECYGTSARATASGEQKRADSHRCAKRYLTIVNLSCLGVERCPAELAVITTV